LPVAAGILKPMTEVTHFLAAVERGDPQAAEQLLPLIYDELRKLATARMSSEAPDHTLQPTALVHEAYLRLVGEDAGHPWNSRGHFFAAAAEAMRRILIENARRKNRVRHGGSSKRLTLPDLEVIAEPSDADVLALNEALDGLATANPRAAELVKLRYFAGLTGREAARILNISPRKADQVWAYARAWLLDCLNPDPD
jgi:RNA polymerase sigma factor (TIGR02999 family)